MGETIQDPQNTDRTTEGQTPQTVSGAALGGEGGTTPKPEVLDKAQVDEIVKREVQKALTKAGRDAKALETKEQALAEKEAKIAQKEKEAEEKELAEAETDEDKAKIKAKYDLKAERKKLAEDKALFEKEKAEHAAELEAAEKEILIWDIAKEAKVDLSDLKDTITELGLTTEEQFKVAAKRLKPTVTTPPLRPDSNKTIGGGKDLSGKSPMQLAREAYTK